MKRCLMLLMFSGSVLALSSCSPKPAETAAADNDAVATPADPTVDSSDPVKTALSAAPAAIARDAAVMMPNPDGR